MPAILSSSSFSSSPPLLSPLFSSPPSSSSFSSSTLSSSPSPGLAFVSTLPTSSSWFLRPFSSSSRRQPHPPALAPPLLLSPLDLDESFNLARVSMRAGPQKGEVRNPWGRAGKPETRMQRQREAAEAAALRAKAWRQAMSRRDMEDMEAEDEVSSRSLAYSIHEFHERSAELLREFGGRLNSLTFGYKWQQYYGESLHSLVRFQQLSVGAMLRQSNRFWVMDMLQESEAAANMQIYVLVEQQQKPSKGQPLGDQLAMMTDSDAIREWKSRRAHPLRVGSGRSSHLFVSDVNAETSEVVRGAMDELKHRIGSAGGASPAEQSERWEEEGDEEGGSCLQLPPGLRSCNKLSLLLDELDVLSRSLPSRLTPTHTRCSNNCSCAVAAADAMRLLHKLEGQAKGRQRKKLDDLVGMYADVIQAGMSQLSLNRMALVLQALEGRAGWDTLVLLSANRVMQMGSELGPQARELTAEDVLTLVRAYGRTGQSDALLYKQVSSACQLIGKEKFTLEGMGAILDGFHAVGLREPQLLRFFSSIIQQMPLNFSSADGVARMMRVLAASGMQDEIAFRRLCATVLQLPTSSFSASSVGCVLQALSTANVFESALLRRLSDIAQTIELRSLKPQHVVQIVGAMTRANRKDMKLLERMGMAVLEMNASSLQGQHIGVIAMAMAEAGYADMKVLDHLSQASLQLEPWNFDGASIAMIVTAYSKLKAMINIVRRAARVESLGSSKTLAREAHRKRLRAMGARRLRGEEGEQEEREEERREEDTLEVATGSDRSLFLGLGV
ncbi:hypothetical protein GUITHDRAFT_144681 [Guillardia theta CCMP2712]|uniref:Uncharacterized protein n=1 Tax=Guillardia theta (strain CCMP2712) TaxID=905079 RepID=L1IPQ1_GUITC|nr:hypothetical protein GUITHDRAFT_144681 [Guillardia theta CCMP2712]EKX37854.1 hypothetical protein GUITHDRAFT_144681 [Guillardia theta CCMP2712]|eukprot:XP_005824834.1 hypothetical protein GUITHDRAFT_144681 [Guillardia theta CCMP2712]